MAITAAVQLPTTWWDLNAQERDPTAHRGFPSCAGLVWALGWSWYPTQYLLSWVSFPLCHSLLSAEICTQPDCTTTGLSWISYGVTTSYVTGNSLKSSTKKQKPRLILYPHPQVTNEEHKEISNLEPSYIGGYMKRTFQNCSCNNGKSLPLFWQNFFSCCSVRALEILHLKYLLGSSKLSKKLSPLGCTEGCDRQAALVLEPLSAELSGKSSLQRLQCHHPIHQEWKRHLSFSQRGCLLCCKQVSHIMYYCSVTYWRIQ